MFEKIKQKGVQILTLHNVETILNHGMGLVVDEPETVLLGIKIPATELVEGGGGESEGEGNTSGQIFILDK